MSKLLPYFRWYPADAESDAKYASMTLAELGLYHRSLNFSWLNDGLPVEDEEVMRCLRVSIDEFKNCWPRVRLCYREIDRKLRNPRQEVEREYAKSKSQKALSAINKRYERTYERTTSVPTDVLPRAYESESECVSESSSVSVIQKHLAKSSGSCAAEKWFADTFWPIWPVKQNRASAIIAARKIKENEFGEVIKGLMRQSQRIAAMERPIHASTWLNQRRWEDEDLSKVSIRTDQRESATERAIREAKQMVMERGFL